MNKLKDMLGFILIITFLGTKMVAPQSIDKLKTDIIERINSVEGTIAVAFTDLNQKDFSILINEDEVFHAASTMKTPVMVEIFKQASLGNLKLDDSILIKNEFTSIFDNSKFSIDLSRDSGEELYDLIGKKRTIRQLVFDMITVSSNLATNILIELIDPDKVMQTLKENNIFDVKVLRGVEDMKAYNAGLNNTVTAKDLMKLFALIEIGDLLPKEYKEEMLNILLSQKFDSMIPAKLPKNIQVAHKTGSIDGVRHDSGIVYLPGGRKYVLIILSKNLKDEKAGVECGADISKMIFDYLTN